MPLNIIRKMVYGERDDFKKKRVSENRGDRYYDDRNEHQIKYDTDCLVAESLIAPKEALIVLSKDPSWVIRDKVASNPIAPKEALITLSKDEYYWIRESVASNPSTPIEILIEFSKDEDLRKSVASNPNTLKDVLTTLSKDEDSRVRMGVAKNPNTPKEALIILSQGKDDNINKTALKRLEKLNLPENKIESIDSKISKDNHPLKNNEFNNLVNETNKTISNKDNELILLKEELNKMNIAMEQLKEKVNNLENKSFFKNM